MAAKWNSSSTFRQCEKGQTVTEFEVVMKAENSTQSNGVRKRGRPCLLTASLEKKFFRGIRNGLPLKHAAQFAGLSYDTVNRWRIRGDEEDAPDEFRHFCKALRHAQAVSMNRLVRSVQKAGRKDWRAAAWLLNQRHPNDLWLDD